MCHFLTKVIFIHGLRMTKELYKNLYSIALLADREVQSHDKFSWLWSFPVNYFIIANMEIPKAWKSPIYIKCFICELEMHNASSLSTVCCEGQWHRETLVSLMPVQWFSFGTQRSEVNAIAHCVLEKKKIRITCEPRKCWCSCSLKCLGGMGWLAWVGEYLKYPWPCPTTWAWVTQRSWKHTHKYLNLVLAPNFNTAKSTVWQETERGQENIKYIPHLMSITAFHELLQRLEVNTAANQRSPGRRKEETGQSSVLLLAQRHRQQVWLS